MANADIVFNISKGRAAEFYWRVKNNDAANSALIVVAIKATGQEDDTVLVDYDDLATILAASNDEATNSGYGRKTLTDADLGALTPDDTNNRMDIDMPDQTWTAVATSGGAWGALIVCYDNDTTAGTDSALIPMTKHVFAVTPDGSDIVAQINAAGFFRAS